MYRVGLGFDLHPLVEDRALILGGVKIDYPRGLGGHSDADVLLHAVMDALLGAAGLNDIGHYFPPGDEKYRNIAGSRLLSEVRMIIEEKGFRVGNVDAVIIAQEPRLAGYIEQMVVNIAQILHIPPSRVAVKATTTERLGVCGRGEAIAAQAVALIERIK